jgi:MSHA biogenesis protein MshI
VAFGFRPQRKPDWCAVVTQGDTTTVAHVRRVPGARPRVDAFARARVGIDDIAGLQALGREHGIARGQVVTLLAAGDYQWNVVDTPAVPEAEWKTAARWGLKDFLDYPPDRATVDVMPQPADLGGAAKPRHLFAVSAHHDRIGACMARFDAARLPLDAIDVPEFALRNVAALYETPGRALAMLDFGPESDLLTITGNGELFLARGFDVDERQFADPTRRDALFERLGLEIQRSLDGFDRQFGGIPVSRLLIAPVPGADALRDALADSVYVPVEVLDLKDAFELAHLPPLLEPEAQAAALTVLGAALRGAPGATGA